MFKLLKKLLVVLTVVLLCNSCKTLDNYVVKGDVIGFSDDIQTSFDYKKGLLGKILPQSEPYNLRTESGNKNMDAFIRNIPRGENTAGYYALDVALDRVKYVRKKVMHKDHNVRYYVIFFTDGLDNVSLAVAKNNRHGFYKNTNSYIKKLNKKKKRVMGWGGNQDYFQIYPILFTGGDLESTKITNNMNETDFDRFVHNVMEGYRGSSKGTVKPSIIYGNNLNTLVEEFQGDFATQNVRFFIPKGYAKKQVRMTFTDYNNNKVIVEGTYVKRFFGGYKFKDLKVSNGLVSDKVHNGGVLKSKNRLFDRSLLSVFNIDNFKYNGKPFEVNKVVQEVYDYGYYTNNIEYESQAESMEKTYVIMVIDGSGSFGENLKPAKDAAVRMRKVVTK